MPMRMGTEMPSLEGATEWINGSDYSVENFKGKPTLVHFWSVSCGVCSQNLPQITAWRDEQKENLNVVAVHMPRYEADTDVAKIHAAIEKYNITELCAVDNAHKLKNAFQNPQGFVPAYYLFDGEGKLKSFAAGERGFGLLKSAVERILSASTEAATA